MASELVTAMESFVAPGPDGIEYVVTANQTITTDHPVYQGREHLFRPAIDMVPGGRQLSPTHGLGGVEDTTAEPGKRRTRTTPAAARNE